MSNRILASITAGLLLASSGAAFAASGTTLAGGADRTPAHKGMKSGMSNKSMMKAPTATGNQTRTGGASGQPGRS